MTDARARYAAAIAASPGVDDPRVPVAFARVPREDFVGPGPWLVLGPEGYALTATADSGVLYDDVVVALDPDKRINNGQPTLHARCLSAARVGPGESVLHIGCGSGYYSAILSELVTPAGKVDAWDIEPALVERATSNLADRSNVAVDLRDALATPIPRKDVIYVCAGLPYPVRAWAEALHLGGRLVFPLTPGWDYGVMLMATRSDTGFDAQVVCRCSFIPCAGGSRVVEEARLRETLSTQRTDSVHGLHFGDAQPDDAWMSGDGWWLSATPRVQ